MRARRPPPPRDGSTSKQADSPSRRPKPDSDSTKARRNSDSSIMDRERILTPEEKILREARRRARENTTKVKEDGKKPNKRMDIIDQLDASGIFGMGSMFFFLLSFCDDF